MAFKLGSQGAVVAVNRVANGLPDAYCPTKINIFPMQFRGINRWHMDRQRGIKPFP